MTDLRSVQRMLRAMKMDNEPAGSGRTCVRWTKESRHELAALALRMDGTAALIGRILGMSSTAVRREAKRLGIKLKARGESQPLHPEVETIIHQQMLTHIAIELDYNFHRPMKLMASLSKTKVKRDNQLLPQLKDYWDVLGSFTWPERKYTNYRINDITDGVLLKYFRRYSLTTLCWVLGHNQHSTRMRASELQAAPRTPERCDVQIHFLVWCLRNSIEPALLEQMTGIPVDTLAHYLSRDTAARRMGKNYEQRIQQL